MTASKQKRTATMVTLATEIKKYRLQITHPEFFNFYSRLPFSGSSRKDLGFALTFGLFVFFLADGCASCGRRN